MFEKPAIGGNISQLKCDRFTLKRNRSPGPVDYIPERSKDFIAKHGESHKFLKTKKEFWGDKDVRTDKDSPGFLYQPKYHFLSKKLAKR